MKLQILFLSMLTLIFCNEVSASNNNLPRLLIKIPTRSRPERFFKMLDLYYAKLSNTIPYAFLISCDIDDLTMNNEAVIEKLQKYPHLYYYFGNNKTKVEAYNANMDNHQDWDIVVIASDDMEPIVQDYDIVIARNMNEHFPDYDGVLNFHDGRLGAELNTYPIIGKKYYNRFGYVYAPCYQASWCREELTNVSRILRREKCFKNCIFKHNAPRQGLNQIDELYRKNEALGNQHDINVYKKNRRPNNFYLNQEMLDEAMPKIWSILICTLDCRKRVFNHIYTKLQKQIADLGLQDQVEVLYFRDNRENSVGFKRNWLMEQSCGKYICSIDDDDDVSDDYIEVIYGKLLKNPDCVNLLGIITDRGKNPQLLVHSIQYKSLIDTEKVYYRPPNHLNPIKRAIGCQFLYPEVNRGEDVNWALQIVKAEILKTAEDVDKPYYFYLYDGTKAVDHEA